MADTQPVKQGDVLVVLDPTDAKLALAEAQAELGQAERQVRGYFATDDALSAQVAARGRRHRPRPRPARQRPGRPRQGARDRPERARQTLARARRRLRRRADRGREPRSTAPRPPFTAAQAALAQAEANRKRGRGPAPGVNRRWCRTPPSQTNPEVAAAQAKVDQAQLDLSPHRAPRAGRRRGRQERQVAGRPAGAGRRAADDRSCRSWAASTSTPTSRKCSCAACSSASRRC